jgi:hypothetical protein
MNPVVVWRVATCNQTSYWPHACFRQWFVFGLLFLGYFLGATFFHGKSFVLMTARDRPQGDKMSL